MIIRNALIATLLLVAVAKANETRWAVLPSGGGDARKLSDLVCVAMTRKGQELVERDELAKIIKENAIGGLADAKGAGQRAALLKLTKADRLLSLTFEQNRGSSHLQATISESELGVRLAVTRIPMTNEEEVVAAVMRLIESTNKRYPSGVQTIVAVAPLRSQNVGYDFEYLSTAYQGLLESAFLTHPGVAVIETAEAHAIASELALSGGELEKRSIPLFIDGTYKVTGKSQQVHLTINAMQAGKSVLQKTESMTLGAATQFFTESIATPLLKSGFSEAHVFMSNQFKWLTHRAEELSQIGLAEQALALREAALLITPEDAKERLNLLADYRNAYCARFDYPKTLYFPKSIGDRSATAEEKQQLLAFETQLTAHRVNLYIRSLRHVEFLIQNSLVGKEKAAELITEHRITSMLYTFSYSMVETDDSHQIQEIFERGEDAEFVFHKRVVPKVLNMPEPEARTGLALDNFQVYMMHSYFRRMDHSWQIKTKKQLDECLYYFNEILSELRSIDERFLEHDSTFDKINGRGITRQEWFDFLKSLSKSTKKVSRLLAEYGLIHTETWKKDQLKEGEKAALAKRVSKWMAGWKTLPSEGALERTEQSIYHKMARLHTELTGIKREKKQRKYRFKKPDDWRTNPKTWGQAWGYPTMLGHMRFKPLTVRFPKGQEPRYLYKVRGLQRSDLFWTPNGVLRMSKDKTMDPVIQVSTIKKAFYDGTYIWVQHGHEQYCGEDTFSVYTATGKHIDSIPKDTLLERSWSLEGIVVREGQFFAMGTIRPDYRNWMAMITIKNNTLTFEPFFHAKKVPTEKTPGNYHTDTTLVFRSSWLHLVNMPDPADNFLLIDRGQSFKKPPLAVDLTTKEVSVITNTYVTQVGDNYMFSSEGTLFLPNGYDRVVRPEKGQPWPAFDRYLYGTDRSEGPGNHLKWAHSKLNHTTRAITQTFFEGAVCQDDAYIYAFGISGRCFRVNKKTVKVDDMSLGKVPRKYGMDWITVTPTHGLIGCHKETSGWEKIRLYEISFSEKASMEDPAKTE